MEQNTTSKKPSTPVSRRSRSSGAEAFVSGKMVTGANTLAHFNIRCPACNKLFRVDSREIKSSSPLFDCSSCKARFTFDSPPPSPNNVVTRTVSMKEAYQKLNSERGEQTKSMVTGLGAEAGKAVETKSCPKCKTPNPGLMKECLKCGVLFEKVESLPLESTMGALPSLVKAWQELMSDYSNITKHVAFVDRCEDLQALPFALKKYEMLREVQPTDKLAKKMFQQVVMRNIFRLSRKADQISWVYKAKKFLLVTSEKVNWTRIRKLTPFALSLALILVGLSSHAARNMVGMGAALLFLTIGLTVFIKGRISLADFW